MDIYFSLFWRLGIPRSRCQSQSYGSWWKLSPRLADGHFLTVSSHNEERAYSQVPYKISWLIPLYRGLFCVTKKYKWQSASSVLNLSASPLPIPCWEGVGETAAMCELPCGKALKHPAHRHMSSWKWVRQLVFRWCMPGLFLDWPSHERSLARGTQLSHSPIPDFHRLYEIINVFCFKMLSFRRVCCATIDYWYT